METSCHIWFWFSHNCGKQWVYDRLISVAYHSDYWHHPNFDPDRDHEQGSVVEASLWTLLDYRVSIRMDV